jgi:hypothetical protein
VKFVQDPTASPFAAAGLVDTFNVATEVVDSAVPTVPSNGSPDALRPDQRPQTPARHVDPDQLKV